ncbi:hypothetical protein Tco_0410667 [Tanacetum coccineum]
MYMANIQEVPTADSGPTYDTEPLEKVQFDDDYNVFATDRQHSEQPKSINDTCVVESIDSNVTPDSSDMCDNEGHANQNAEDPEDEHVMLASLIANFKLDLDENKKSQRKIKKANTFANPLYLKKAQKEKPCLYNVKYDKNDLANLFAPESEETLRLAEEIRSKLCKEKVKPYDYTKQKSKGVDTNFERPSILGKPPLQAIKNQRVVRQPSAYKSERSQFPKHQFVSQVDVSNDLTKPVTPHSWPQVRKSSFAKPYHVNASGPSRNRPKHVSFQSPRESVGSNNMVHNYYLEEANNKAQLQKDMALNTKPSV